MPLFQYFGWVGGFLFAANWCVSAPIAPRRLLTFRSIRESTSGSIRSINGPNAWCSTRRARRWRLKRRMTPRPTLAEAKRQLRQSAHLSTRSPRWRRSPSGRVFGHPPTLVRLRRGRPRRFKNGTPILPSIAARKGLTFPTPPHKPPGRSGRVRARRWAARCAALSRPRPSKPA